MRRVPCCAVVTARVPRSPGGPTDPGGLDCTGGLVVGLAPGTPVGIGVNVTWGNGPFSRKPYNKLHHMLIFLPLTE